MNVVEIVYPNRSKVWVSATPRSRIQSLEFLFQQLYQTWIDQNLNTTDLLTSPDSWYLIERIAKFFPRVDLPGQWGFDLKPLRNDVEQLRSLFLADLPEGAEEYQPAKLVALNCFKPLEMPVWRATDDSTPPTPSGNADMDMLAMLTLSTNAQDAFDLMDRLTTEQLDRYLFYLAELRRDPEEREQEAMAEDYLAWKSENQDLVRESLGIKFNFPTAETAETQ